RVARVGVDPADGARDEEDVLGAVGAEPVVDGRLVAKVELVARRREDVREALALEDAEDRRADEPPVTGDEDPGLLVDREHGETLASRCGGRCAPPPSPRGQANRHSGGSPESLARS